MELAGEERGVGQRDLQDGHLQPVEDQPQPRRDRLVANDVVEQEADDVDRVALGLVLGTCAAIAAWIHGIRFTGVTLASMPAGPSVRR